MTIEVTNTNNNAVMKTVNQTTWVGGVKPEIQGMPMDWYLKEDKANKVTHIDEHSTDIQYPSAKCVYDAISQIEPSTGVQSDWEQDDTAAPDFIKNKPEIPVVPTNVSSFTNDAGYITLNDVPSQVNADWNSNSGASQILNKPSLSTVATSGSYADLSNKPTIPTQAQSITTGDTGYTTGEQVYNYIQSLDGSQISY